MTENEFLLQDRLTKIKSTIEKYGEENFYLSFSGGKDSTVLSALIDMALPENKIPRVYANTGIEYRMILEFVERERERASVGTAYHKTKRANQADVGAGGLPIQKQISCRESKPIPKAWKNKKCINIHTGNDSG